MITFLDFDNYDPTKQIILKEDNSPVNIILKANESNLVNALLDNNPDVVGIRYISGDFNKDIETLKSILPEKLSKPVIYKLDLSGTAPKDITYQTLLDYISKTPSSVRLVIKCPQDFVDLGIVLSISQVYGNIHFCGGKFMAHPLGRFGCITQSDINLYLDTQPPVIYTGCCLSDKLILSTSALLEYRDKDIATSNKPKTKSKNATTLFSLSKTGLGAF